MPKWEAKFDEVRNARDGEAEAAYRKANCDAVSDTLGGSAAYAGGQARNGAAAVINMPAVRAVAVMQPPAPGTGRGKYENRYTYARRVGLPLPAGFMRGKIDKELAGIDANSKLDAQNGHYAAMELNGTGIRYFGDICLVLKPGVAGKDALTLQRNSYEIGVQPTLDRYQYLGSSARAAKFTEILEDWAGRWDDDGVYIAAHKIMENHPAGTRRMTTGTVSDGVVVDEDYIEIIMSRGFTRLRIAELRLTAQDAAAEALTGDQARVGIAPTAAAALWRYRRRVVTTLARRIGVPVRVVTTTGRAR